MNVVNGYIIYNKGSVVDCEPGPRRGREREVFLKLGLSEKMLLHL